jgi:hypothetical protein
MRLFRKWGAIWMPRWLNSGPATQGYGNMKSDLRFLCSTPGFCVNIFGVNGGTISKALAA